MAASVVAGVEPIPSKSFTVEPNAPSSTTRRPPGFLRLAERPMASLDRRLATSTYDNLHEETVSGNVDMINDIIAQVMLAQCQSEQLDKIDHVQVDWQCLEANSGGGSFVVDYDSPTVSPGSFIVESEEQSAMQIIDSNFIIINDIVIPKSRDHDISRLDVSLSQKGSVCMPSHLSYRKL